MGEKLGGWERNGGSRWARQKIEGYEGRTMGEKGGSNKRCDE
jgi:hypothetical protein